MVSTRSGKYPNSDSNDNDNDNGSDNNDNEGDSVSALASSPHGAYLINLWQTGVIPTTLSPAKIRSRFLPLQVVPKGARFRKFKFNCLEKFEEKDKKSTPSRSWRKLESSPSSSEESNMSSDEESAALLTAMRRRAKTDAPSSKDRVLVPLVGDKALHARDKQVHCATWVVKHSNSYMAITHLPAGVNAEHVSAVRDTTLHNTIKLSWDASNMRSEEGVDSLFAGGNPQDNIIQRIKNTIIADNGAKASQDSKLPPKNIMLLQFPENVKSLAAPWECSCVEGLSNVAVGTTFPGLHFMDGYLITNWGKEDWDAGTINKGGFASSR